MSITKSKEKVRDGFLGDLPDDLQSKVMNIHKLIKDTVHDLLDDSNYEDLKESKWAMSCIDEFCTMPKDKADTGSVRVYKNGKTYRCMIQATGHFRNHQYGWIEELLHDFINNVYTTVRPKIRRKYDMTITNEGRTGEPFEGFDIYPNPKTVKDIWDMFEGRKTKTITEEVDDGIIECSQDLADYYEYYHNMSYDTFFCERSHGLLKKSFRVVTDIETGHTIKIVFDLNTDDVTNVGHNTMTVHPKLNELKPKIKTDGNNTFSSTGTVLAIIDVDDNNKRLNSVTATGPVFSNSDSITYTVGEKETVPTFKSTSGKTIEEYDGKHVYSKSKENVQNEINSLGRTYIPGHGFVKKARYLDIKGAPTKMQRKMEEELAARKEAEHNKRKNCDHNWVPVPDTSFVKGMSKCSKCGLYKNSKGKICVDPAGSVPFTESTVSTPEYNVDMSETEAKKTLRTLSQGIINDTANKKDYKVSQYTANIYANIITKNLLPIWAKGFRKFSITLDSYQSFFTFEFKTPPMTQDFVSRFVNGRESINGFIHRNSEIKVKMSPRIFHTMKNPDDAFNFFRAAIKYYDGGLEKTSERLMVEVMRLNREMKYLIATSKLSGVVTYPMSLLFVFDDVHMDNKDTFKISSEDIKTINQFIKGIYTKYASPDKEKRKIVEDVKEMVKALRESCDPDNETIKALRYLPEAVENYLFGGYQDELKKFNENWIHEQVDIDWSRKQTNGQVQYLQEKFGVKKLKKIPTDLVAYITIETEAIKDANDKMMISSYCLSKIEIVEWYIELLDVGSKKYIVPHTKPYLESVRTQLLACFKKIMDTPIPKKNRPLIDIQYPQGYEG